MSGSGSSPPLAYPTWYQTISVPWLISLRIYHYTASLFINTQPHPHNSRNTIIKLLCLRACLSPPYSNLTWNSAPQNPKGHSPPRSQTQTEKSQQYFLNLPTLNSPWVKTKDKDMYIYIDRCMCTNSKKMLSVHWLVILLY